MNTNKLDMKIMQLNGTFSYTFDGGHASLKTQKSKVIRVLFKMQIEILFRFTCLLVKICGKNKRLLFICKVFCTLYNKFYEISCYTMTV